MAWRLSAQAARRVHDGSGDAHHIEQTYVAQGLTKGVVYASKVRNCSKAIYVFVAKRTSQITMALAGRARSLAQGLGRV